MKTVKIGHGAGDIIAAVPYIKALGGTHVYMLYQVPFIPHWHPVNHGAIVNLTSFIEKQGLIAYAIPWVDLCLYRYDIDMDLIDSGWTGALGDIYTWNSLFCGVYPDMTKPFLYVEDVDPKNVMVITQTARYVNPVIDYRALNDYSCDKVFIGTESEYNFAMELYSGLKNIEYVPTADFYEASKIIKASKLFISNQTALAVIAEGIAHNRIMVVNRECPYAIMKTPNGRPVLIQRFFEQAIADMYN